MGSASTLAIGGVVAGEDSRRAKGLGLPGPGDVVAGHRIERELARGGMGAVYVATDALDRRVALKVMLRAGAPDARRRFEREARAAAHVAHPGIVKVHALGEDERGLPFISMELVDGESLQERLARGPPFDAREAARLVRGAAEALAAAHAVGVTHRDLKPHNLLVDRSGRVRLTDFGVAKVEDQSAALSKTGQLLGTPAYMSPEQVAGRVGEQGPPADVYGLGATLFALLAGASPWEDLPPLALLAAILHERAPAPSSRRPGVPAALDAICATCLEKDPARRYPSMAALAADLTAFLEGRATGAALRRADRRRLAGLCILGALVAGLFVAAIVSQLALAPRPDAASAAAVDTTPPEAPGGTEERVAPRVVGSFELDVEPGAGAVVEVEVTPAIQTLALTLAEPTPGDWGLAAWPLERPEDTLATLVDGQAPVLILDRDAALPLRPGRWAVAVRGPTRGQARLRGRVVAVESPRPDDLPALDWDEPLPPIESCVRPVGQTAVAQATRMLLNVANHPDRSSQLVAQALQRVEVLLAEHGTARGPLLLAALHRRARGNTIEAWRHREGWLRPLAALEPDLYASYYLGRLGDRLEDQELALPNLERARALAPPDLGHLRAALLRCLLAAGRHADARAEGLDLLARGTRDADTHRVLGLALLEGHAPPDWRGVDCLLFAARRHGAVGRLWAIEQLADALFARRAQDPRGVRVAAGRAAPVVAEVLGDRASGLSGGNGARAAVAVGLIEGLAGHVERGRRRALAALQGQPDQGADLAGFAAAHERLAALDQLRER